MGKLKMINIPELNTLRFIFMTMIFLHHMNNFTLFPAGGYLGVSFFFVLSGFCMTLGYKDRVMESDFSYSHYITKRVTKFYPIHWLVLFSILFLRWLGSGTIVIGDHFWPKLISNFFLVQSFIPNKSFYFSFNSPSWYLCNTLFNCLLFPFVLKAILKISKRVELFFAVALCYVMLVIFVPEDYRHAILYINPFVRLFDFVFGIFTGLFFMDFCQRETCKTDVNTTIWLKLAVILLFGSMAFFSLYDIDKEVYSFIVRFYWMIFCPMIFAVSVISIRKSMNGGGEIYMIIRVIRKLGSYSFTFYMIHIPCISFGIYERVCIGFGLAQHLFVNVLVTFTLTMIASFFVQKYFVEPVGSYLTKKISK